MIDKVEHYQYIYKVEKVQLENAGRYQCKAVYGGSEAKTTVSAKKSTVVLGKNLLTFPYLVFTKLLNFWQYFYKYFEFKLYSLFLFWERLENETNQISLPPIGWLGHWLYLDGSHKKSGTGFNSYLFVKVVILNWYTTPRPQACQLKHKPPGLSKQPVQQNAKVGTDVTITAVYKGDAPAFSVKWYGREMANRNDGQAGYFALTIDNTHTTQVNPLLVCLS